MPIPKTHLVKIVANNPNITAAGDPSINVPYPYKVVCSCQFEALARDEQQASFYAKGHAGYQKVMGHKAEVENLVKKAVEEVGSAVGGAAESR